MTTPLPARIQAIRERIAAATPGPWRKGQWLHQSQNAYEWNVFADGSEVTPVVGTIEPDAELIAAAPTDLAFLTAALEVAMGALEFYGDKKYWEQCYRPDIKAFVPANSTGTSCIEEDEGRTSREALSRIEKLSGEV